MNDSDARSRHERTKKGALASRQETPEAPGPVRCQYSTLELVRVISLQGAAIYSQLKMGEYIKV